jgi:hypothetical protein
MSGTTKEIVQYHGHAVVSKYSLLLQLDKAFTEPRSSRNLSEASPRRGVIPSFTEVTVEVPMSKKLVNFLQGTIYAWRRKVQNLEKRKGFI